jgi:hypothetical protein
MPKKIIELSKEELQSLINTYPSYAQISKKIGISYKTLLRWLNKYQFEKNRIYKCSCGESNSNNFTIARFNECKKCRSERQLILYLRYKQQAVDYKGGKCEKCGYNKCLACLDFHHIDPSQKDPDWRKMNKRAFKNIKDELDKCTLLCKNCHGEKHYLETEIDRKKHRLYNL